MDETTVARTIVQAEDQLVAAAKKPSRKGNPEVLVQIGSRSRLWWPEKMLKGQCEIIGQSVDPLVSELPYMTAYKNTPYLVMSGADWSSWGDADCPILEQF
ncbi:hypothetical protein M513_11399 [Trichuris suis]|uniref:Uncharacterized protein n=1 Tax=Trichuris suis TaxID=68888 RepID=A0A085LRX5_9BILA|nr:hypothetical protein M513_11399 [Trichuris suis]